MSTVVWKWPLLGLVGVRSITAPEGVRWLHLDMQDGIPTLWGMCNPDNEPAGHIIRIIGTGHDFDHGDRLQHLGTLQMGGFVWHYFLDAS